MKLLYIWIENYNNLIVNQEFSLSPEYIIHYDRDKGYLSIAKNTDYIPDFYGKNILDITAVVGENGAGKTTLTTLLYECCNSIIPVDDNYKKGISEKIIIYSQKQKDGKDKLSVFYFVNAEIHFFVENEVLYYQINLNQMSAEAFDKEIKQHQMSTVYFTNAIDIRNEIPNEGMGEFIEGGKQKSIYNSAFAMIDKEKRKLQKSYGSDCKETAEFNTLIRTYSQKMGISAGQAYLSAFVYNFLLVVSRTPGSIAIELPYNAKFKLNVVEFGEYIRKHRGSWETFDGYVYFIRENIYGKLCETIGKNNWEKFYINILCEIVLFYILQQKQECIDKAESETRSDFKSEKAYKIIAEESINDSEKRQMLARIKNTKKIDISILRDFLECCEKQDTKLADTQWYHQVKKFYKEYNTFELPDIIDYGYSVLIAKLLADCEETGSYFKRMIKINTHPVSSGEMALINIFSSLYKVMTNHTMEDNILLFLDEIDAFLHPRWQQRILLHLTSWINENENFNNKKVQIILASHSPIILSDIPRDRVIYLKTGKQIQRDRKTFGANIGSLYYDSFFMDKGSIGNIARGKIQKVINCVEKGEKPDFSKEELYYIIENIGEPFLRDKLKRDIRLQKLVGEDDD